MNDFADLRATLQANGVADVDGEVAQLAAVIEATGQAEEPARLAADIASITRAIGVFGAIVHYEPSDGISTAYATVSPAQLLEVVRFGRRATPPLSETFVLGTAGALLPALNSFSGYVAAITKFRRIVCGDLTRDAIEALNALGLVRGSDVVPAGYEIAGADLAVVDPHAWFRDWLLRASRQAGAVSREAVRERICQIFTGTAALLVCTMAAEATWIEEHRTMLFPPSDQAEAERRLAIIEAMVTALWPVTQLVHTADFRRASAAALLPTHLSKAQIGACTDACAAGKQLADAERSRLAVQ